MRSPAPPASQPDGATVAGAYRYLLWRTWDAARPRLLWVLFNPSTADASREDPTLHRCRGFSRTWGYGGLEVVNLFAFRTPHPRDLLRAADPIGPENDAYLAAAVARAPAIVAAWGAHGGYRQRDRDVLALLARHAAQPFLCLGTLQNGCPRHPLYLPGDASPTAYRPLCC